MSAPPSTPDLGEAAEYDWHCHQLCDRLSRLVGPRSGETLVTNTATS
jgi:hypothetical protein